MISQELADELVAAFSALPYWHTLEDEGVLELSRAIQKHAQDDAHAERIKDELIYGDRVPSPGDIRSTALSTRAKEDDFHHEPMTPEQIEENKRWADEMAKRLKEGDIQVT